ncbi:TRAM domain-containing protein [Janibacter sp. UYMM211]|uniref:class I SAM-dependent RNA methyltransferase n=1 Tax=Janibacter sp. UYMM211 TaxID=3156342 RepID=UPI0033991910
MTTPAGDELAVGDEIEVVVGPVAHGGHCVARHDGRVVFVRHTIPGERVVVRITEGGPGDRFVRGDAVEVLEASEHRVPRRCPVSGPGGCGGCDLQHVSTEHQRTLKAQVVVEQLQRLGGVEREVVVEALADADGLGYRTRVEVAVGREGGGTPFVGLRKHRSHDLVPVTGCPIAHPRVDEGIAAAAQEAAEGGLEDAVAVDVVAASGEEDVALVEVGPQGRAQRITLTERVATPTGEREMSVDARGFWQVHADAPRAFVEAVLEAAQVQPGERVLDLYSGVGLLSLPLAEATGPEGQLLAVESDPLALDHLAENLAEQRHAVVVPGRVDDLLGVPRQGRRRGQRGGRAPARSQLLPPSADVVVLDPPRTGAGRGVVEALLAMRPRRLVYVACDPAALGRDTATLRAGGYELDALRSLDAFPMTHHVECVATFVPAG